MPNIPRNVNNFLNFPAEKSKTYANRYSFDRIFAEKSLNSVERYSDVSAAHGIINPPFSCLSSIATAQYRENHRTGLRADCGFLIFDSKKSERNCSDFSLAGVLRLELRRTVLETAMLPLHHTPKA